MSGYMARRVTSGGGCAPIELQTDPGDPPPSTKVKVERGAARTTVRFPLPSWLGMWCVSALIVIAAAYLCGVYLWQDMVGFAVVAAIVFAVIPLPALALTVRRIDAGHGGLTLHFPMRTKRISVEDVGVAGDELTFDGSRPAWTAIPLRSRAEAEWVAYGLRRALHPLPAARGEGGASAPGEGR